MQECWSADAIDQLLLRTHVEDTGSTSWRQRQRRESEILPIDTNGPHLIGSLHVHFYDGGGHAHQLWRLIPARVEGMFAPSQSESFGLGSLPPLTLTTRSPRVMISAQ